MLSTFEILTTFVCICLSVFGFYRVLSHKLVHRFEIRNQIGGYLIASIFYGLFLISNYLHIPSIAKPVFLLIFSGILFVLYTDKPFKRIFWIIIPFFLINLAELILLPFALLITRGDLELAINQNVLSTLLSLAAQILLQIFISYMLHTQKKVVDVFIREFFLILLVDVAYMILVISFFYFGTATVTVNTAILLSLFVLFLITLLSLFLLRKISIKSEELLNTNLKLQQMEMEHKQNQDISLIVEDLRSLRHDMNNHMSILQGLMSMKEYEEATSYLANISEELSLANSYVFPDNKVLSVLLNNKISKARQLGISFDTELLTSQTPFSDMDLCTILGNIIENAIEASSTHEHPYISLSIRKTKASFVIQCDNTYTVEPIFENGKLKTTKKEKSYHGIGTQNITSTVEKYHGTCQFSVDDQFHVSIQIPNK